MIAVDTNVLVYAHRRDSDAHEPSRSAVEKLAEGTASWAIPWPCVHEFIAVVTHPRIYRPPSTLDEAFSQLEAWARSPTLHLLGETHDHLEVLRSISVTGRVSGAVIHDARIAAVCTANGVHELLSTDRDFSRFPTLRVRNPIVGGC